MNAHYDVVVLGSGNAGMAAAGVAREVGKSVAVVESWDVGGTCALRGCVPKKVLVAAAQTLHQISLASEHQIEVGEAKLDWAKLIARERTFVDNVPDEFAKSLESRDIDILRGQAKFIGTNTLEVDGKSIEVDKIVIATGSKPRELSIPGSGHLITSDDILETPTLPDTLIFIGGGVIALEFAHVFARAGTKITILEAMPRLLPRLDVDAVTQLHKATEDLGIEILTDVAVTTIEQVNDKYTVYFTHDGEDKSLTVDRVANGTGRIPNVEALDLDAGEIQHDGPRIEVDDTLRSVSNPDIYVAGDALWSSPQLSPVATYAGQIAGENLVFGTERVPYYGDIPSAVYAVPALASVGLTEAEARDKGLKFSVKINDMASWRSAKTYAETAAWSKVLIDDESNQILGAHIFGHGAEEIIHLFSFAMKHGVSADELKRSVYSYPTFASDIKYLV